jgi:cysteine-rich repeat protein
MMLWMRCTPLAIAMLALGCASGSGDGDDGSAGLGEGSGTASEAGDGAGDGSAPGSADDGSVASSGDTAGSDDGPADDADSGSEGVCGDAAADPGEACDDGNRIRGDGCNPDCRASGELQWAHAEPGAAAQDDEVLAIAESNDGGAFAVGLWRNADGTTDGWIRKINPLGGMLWTKTHDGPASGSDVVRGVALGTGGLFVVAGQEAVTGQSANVWVRQYDDTGDPQWTDTFNGEASGSDSGNGITIDAFGDIVVVGHTTTSGEARDVLLRKYTPEGAVAWTRTYSGAAGGTDHGYAVGTSASGEIYAVGYETVTGEGKNAWLGKYDTDGNLLWSRVVNGEAGLDDELRGVTVSAEGPVVCGIQWDVEIPWQSFVRKYDPDGSIVWTELYSGGSNEGALCNAIAVDPGGDLVWTGGENVGTVREIVVRRLDADGNERWTTRVPAASDGPDQGRGIAIAGSGEILVGGRVDAGVDGLDVWAGGFTP